MDLLVALDIGTSSVRSIAYDLQGQAQATFAKEIGLSFPEPRYVEQDPAEILSAALEVLRLLENELKKMPARAISIGITNQRETVIAFDSESGKACYNAISWQDGRGLDLCSDLIDQGLSPLIRQKTGLELNPYFSATKMTWLTKNGYLASARRPKLVTVDAFIAWHLMGANPAIEPVTDPSNASRTLLYNLDSLAFDEELTEIFGIDFKHLPNLVDTAEIALAIAPGMPFSGVTIGSIIGDQQSSLFGQGMITPMSTKVTHGTGTFAVTNVGQKRISPKTEVLESIAWKIGDQSPTYCLEGSIFTSGVIMRWLRDSLGLISNYSEIDTMASSVQSSDGVVVIPAFQGLGAPYWRTDARGAIFGISTATTPAHIIRASIEGVVMRTQEVIEAMERASGSKVETLSTDGGLSTSNFVCQLQADQTRIPTVRAKASEATAFGAALLAGISQEVIDLPQVAEITRSTSTFNPSPSAYSAKARRENWNKYIAKIL